MSEVRGPEHWAELVQRGKHGSTGSTNSRKSQTPVREAKKVTPDPVSPPKVKSVVSDSAKPMDTATKAKGRVCAGVVKNLNGKANGTKCLCTVQGFPPAARVREDGAIHYSLMDDEGGSWEFMGLQDQVLVEWSIYDGATNSIDNGSTV